MEQSPYSKPKHQEMISKRISLNFSVNILTLILREIILTLTLRVNILTLTFGVNILTLIFSWNYFDINFRCKYLDLNFTCKYSDLNFTSKYFDLRFTCNYFDLNFTCKYFDLIKTSNHTEIHSSFSRPWVSRDPKSALRCSLEMCRFVMVIIVRDGPGNTSSNPGRGYSGFEEFCYFPEHYIFYGNTNELRKLSLTTQQRKLFAALNIVCFWCCKTRRV